MSDQRYPLAWPRDWRRTPRDHQQRARFSQKTRRYGGTDGTSSWLSSEQLTVASARKRLETELDRLRARQIILSTNLALRLDGLPRSGHGEPPDPGVAIYFQLLGKPRTLACDRWDRVADNMAAIAGHIAAIRAVDRYGVGTLEQAFAGYAALPPAAIEWWVILGVPPDAPLGVVETAFRNLARQQHPDARGGSHDGMARLTEARQAAREALA
jgi:hypothetical protein